MWVEWEASYLVCTDMSKSLKGNTGKHLSMTQTHSTYTLVAFSIGEGKKWENMDHSVPFHFQICNFKF